MSGYIEQNVIGDERAVRHCVVPVQHATVYLSGAELSSEISLELPVGPCEIVFAGVAGNIDEQSLAVDIDGDVTVLSSRVENYHLDDALPPEVEAARQRLDAMLAERDDLTNQMEVIKAQVDVMTLDRSGDNAPSAIDTERLIMLIGERMTPLLATRAQLQQRLSRLDEKIARAKKQLAELQKRAEKSPSGQIVASVLSEQAATYAIRLRYVVPDAGWVPSYDVHAGKLGAPVQLIYKASVYQACGIDWNGVRLTLSTHAPHESAEAPVLRRSFVEKVVEMPVAAAGAAMVFEESAPMLRRAPRQKSLDRHVHTDAEGIAVRFDIDLPYTIPSDGKSHVVMIKSAELSGRYRHFAVPKIDCDAFLQVSLSDWEPLNLLPAQSNIFFGGSYVGQGRIDPRQAEDSIDISLGRDKAIVIRRENDKTLRGKRQIFGNDVRDVYAYSVDVHNTRQTVIELIVLDQVPVSRSADVGVIDIGFDGDATHDTETGELKWQLQLPPNEARQLRFGYTVKYPKDAEIVEF